MRLRVSRGAVLTRVQFPEDEALITSVRNSPLLAAWRLNYSVWSESPSLIRESGAKKASHAPPGRDSAVREAAHRGSPNAPSASCAAEPAFSPGTRLARRCIAGLRAPIPT